MLFVNFEINDKKNVCKLNNENDIMMWNMLNLVEYGLKIKFFVNIFVWLWMNLYVVFIICDMVICVYIFYLI